MIFDCDGVLVDSEPIAIRVLAESARELGWQVSAEEAPNAFPKGGTLADQVVRIERRIGRPVPGDFEQRFRAALYRALSAEVRPVPGIRDVLDALPCPTCVASNGPRQKIHTSLTTAGLLARFEGRIFTAYDLPRAKPFPDLYLHAAATLGAEPARCVVVEDSVTGVQAGIAAGMRVLGYAADPAERAPLAEAGAEVFVAMRELLGLLRAPG